jgi:hypothetical protein
MRIPYGYACELCGLQRDCDYERGDAPGQITAEHFALDADTLCRSRVFKRDYSSSTVSGNDPIRKGYLDSRLEHNLAIQGRPLDPMAPKDKFEAEHVRRKTGRVYFGNDTSKLNPTSRKIVESNTLDRMKTPGMSHD